jgi:hypothetical protein
MADLSPAAQAVLDAWAASENGVYLLDDPDRLAAALRALAESAVPMPLRPYDSCCDHQRAFINTRIRDIASELESFDA